MPEKPQFPPDNSSGGTASFTFKTLYFLRMLFQYSLDEAAEYIGGGVSTKTYRLWEVGRKPIPSDVIERADNIKQWCKDKFAEMSNALDERQSTEPRTPVEIPIYTPDDFQAAGIGQPQHWRPYCSVVSQLCMRYHNPTFI